MMLAGQTVLGGVGQHTAQHAAQGVARQDVVSDMIGRHYQSCRVQIVPSKRRSPDSPIPACYPGSVPRSAGVTASGGNPGKLKWRLLLPGASEPRLAELNPLGLQTWFFKPLKRPEQPEHSCRLQLLHSPITAEPYREKTRPLRPRRSCFAPAETRQLWLISGFGGGAGCCPRVRMVYCDGNLFP